MIHVIGDSHVVLFSGQDVLPPVYPEPAENKLNGFKVYRLGAVLAYNLKEEGHTSQGREKLAHCLNTVPMHEKIMLCFGEIDVRTQLIKQATLQKRSLATIAELCVNRYFPVIRLLAQSRPLLVWATPPQSMTEHSSNKFPTVGTGQERNAAARLFNASLEEHCRRSRIPFVSIFDAIVSADNVSDMSYFFDTAHLSQKALPFALEALEDYL